MVRDQKPQPRTPPTTTEGYSYEEPEVGTKVSGVIVHPGDAAGEAEDHGPAGPVRGPAQGRPQALQQEQGPGHPPRLKCLACAGI